MVDQFDIAQTARDLLNLYRELDSAKRHQVVREARVTRPAPGPQAPSPTHLLSLEVELTDRLFELIRDCANHIQPTKILTHDGVRLCGWIAWHAGDIAELDFATDLHDEMQDQIRLIKHKVDNLPGAEPKKISRRFAIDTAKQSDQWGTADELAPLVANITGTPIDRTKITSIGRNPKFTTRINHRGHKQYSLAELVDHFTNY